MLQFLHRLACIAVVFTLFIHHILCSFSLEELKLINYEVDILATPVKLGEGKSLPVLHMISKFGQQYQCLLPQLQEKEEFSDKDSSSDESTDIKDLLKPLESGPCLLKTKDWWTYELCFGRYVKQYHIDEGKILGQVITLGLYDSDFDWKNETVKEKFGQTKQKFHSQTYSNGTKCDLTGLPRNAEVRLFCEKDAGDYIYRVDEPGTCSYVLTVYTSRVCSHPMLRPPPSNKAHSIACSPLLSEEQYAKYLIKANREKLLAEEKRNVWLLDQQRRLKVMKDWAKESFLHLDGEEAQKVSEGVEVVGNENKLFEEQKSSSRMPKTEDSKRTGTIIVHEYEVNEKNEDKVIGDDMDEEEKFLLEEYDQELEKMKATSASPESFATVKENIQKEFDTLLSEASEEDLDQDLNEDAKDGAFSKLAATLNMLLEKLDKAEKDVAKATIELEKAKHKINSKKTEDKVPSGTSEEDVLEDDDEPDYDEMIMEEDELSKTVKSKTLEDKLKVAEDDRSQSSVLDDDKVHVRIRRLDRKSADANGKLHEMDFAQRKKLEQAVKEKLEKAGLDTGGRRIEVKIITAGYYDSEDGKDFHALSEEEASQFQNMIMALLTGQQEAVQEMERHKKLEENYNMVWGYDEKKSHEEEE